MTFTVGVLLNSIQVVDKKKADCRPGMQIAKSLHIIECTSQLSPLPFMSLVVNSRILHPRVLYSAEMSSTKSRPTLAELPLNPNDPPYSAWGLWGVDDEVGTLVNSAWCTLISEEMHYHTYLSCLDRIYLMNPP